MYRSPAFEVTDTAELHRMLDGIGTGHLVVHTVDGGMEASFLPLLLDTGPDDGPLGTLRGHLARPNPLWTVADPDAPALVIAAGPDAYVSPSWYPSKREHGRVVPTWNYEAVHVHGRLTVRREAAWLLDLVTRLTDRHEAGRAEPWRVTDAPAEHVAGLLQAVVGLELRIERMEGKRKLSQNRPEADRAGVVAGLTAGTPTERVLAERMVAERMRDLG